PLTRDELDIFAAEGVALARREVPERHSECAADLRLQMVHRAGEAVGRKPFRERVRLDERAIDFLGAGRQDPVQAYGSGHVDPPLGIADSHRKDERGLADPTGGSRISRGFDETDRAEPWSLPPSMMSLPKGNPPWPRNTPPSAPAAP